MAQRLKKNYIIVGHKSWNKKIFLEKIKKFPGNWFFIGNKKELFLEKIKKINPDKIFFLHWSWLIPEEIANNYECVCFHMTDVPYGRGGSPLQNLIIRGHKKTKLTALRMTEKFDAGPVYLKRDLSLAGSAEEIYKRATELSAKIILYMIKNNSVPIKQKGKVVVFKRRKPEQSEILECKNLEDLHDFIRMLDAEGYPKAFIKYKSFIFKFSEAKILKNKIKANVEIEKYEK